MVSVLAFNAVDRWLESRFGQTKYYKYVLLLRKARSIKEQDWLARNQDNVSELGGMSIRRMLLQ